MTSEGVECLSLTNMNRNGTITCGAKSLNAWEPNDTLWRQVSDSHVHDINYKLQHNFYAYINSACPSVCLFVCSSVTRVDQSKTLQARIIKFSSSAAWKTPVSETVKFFHKFEGGHPERGH